MSRSRLSSRRRLLALVIACTALAVGCGEGDGESTGGETAPEVPAGAIAVVAEVPDGTITEDDFDEAIATASSNLGREEVPGPDQPSYPALAERAQSDLILARWFDGEAAERDLVISERAIDERMDQILRTEFNDSERDFQKFLADAGYTTAEARERIRLELISSQIEETITAEAPQDPDLPPAEQAIAEQEYVQAEANEFEAKWRERTQCADDFLVELCANGPEPEPDPAVPPPPGELPPGIGD